MRASCMRALLLAAVLALPCGAASARQHDAEKLPITHIRDLHYGDALFYFYQDDDFAALTRLLAYEHWGRYDEAIGLLASWRGPLIWSAYARFNLGVALVRNGRLDDADPFLSGVGTMLAATAEQAALRDRANLALGFAYLQANQPARA